ncbi:uncharacterized protein LOC105421427 isoform X3 [Amborella trichopoda]|uniref:uncharacterized protein LOC105421427 isoform X3 n=1 Tax=Amborella trichopoda TaxID=13333 RepID=UPI0009BEB653|nr:uncharacterized protein LOC105421427 isoform X3 [Amborella trichopoda]|eukprot:XP_020529385.1 uncharacterized protein LOC105421427 isoform X3 [Amborella trichopoda]
MVWQPYINLFHQDTCTTIYQIGPQLLCYQFPCDSQNPKLAARRIFMRKSQLGKIWQVHNLTEVHLDSIIIQQKEKLDQLDDKEIEAKEIQRLKCCYDIAMTRCIRRFCQGACPLDAIV